MNEKTYIIIIVGIVSVILIGLVFTLKFYNENIQQINDSNLTLYVKTLPISSHVLNKTTLTSLVSSTEQVKDQTIIHLMNNLTIKTNRTDIKSGDIIELNAIILKPDCGLSLITNSNQTLVNGTKVKIELMSDPRCSEDSKIIDIVSWNKDNQK